MFVSGQSTFDAGVFGVLSMLVGIFTAIKVFNWVGTLYKGSIAFKTPFLYVCGFLFFLVFGGMTGIAVATVSLDVHWHDTYFVVAHFHFIMVGATIMAFLVGAALLVPQDVRPHATPSGWGLVAAALIILGFIATFIPQFLLGNAGHAAPLLQLPGALPGAQRASTAGASLLAFGFIIILIYLVLALRPTASCRRRTLGLAGLRVDDHVAAAAQAQLRRSARSSPASRTTTSTPPTRRSAVAVEPIPRPQAAPRPWVGG